MNKKLTKIKNDLNNDKGEIVRVMNKKKVMYAYRPFNPIKDYILLKEKEVMKIGKHMED